MPRCRKGYFHVFNNHYTSWGMYAIGGSANPTINSQGNHFTPPANPHALEVTKRTETSGEGEWSSWNWRSTDDVFENGAFFVPSGDQSDSAYQKATSSADVKSGGMTKQLTSNVGMLILTPNGLAAAGNGVLNTVPGVKEWNFGNIFDQGGGAPLQSTISPQTAFKIAVAIIILVILVSVIKRFRKKTNGK
ncbi:unnamed protein product [Cuscuta epithymum]|uniref:Pectate lyase n=1 Tax=Cuscuta epithymum TaxID=186058 RepID=A0AAV0CP99_9ASTE|nr:unnamed protein product [Cuscuta epithymum]